MKNKTKKRNQIKLNQKHSNTPPPQTNKQIHQNYNWFEGRGEKEEFMPLSWKRKWLCGGLAASLV